MKAHYLGHVVFYVRDLERSLAFYHDLLGFQEIGRAFAGKAAALTSGRTHHELLLIEVGPEHDTRPPQALSHPPKPEPAKTGSFPGDAPLPGNTRPARTRRDGSPSPGFYQIGIKSGDSLDELRQAKAELDRAGVPIGGMSDHTVSQSLYLQDPDGNEVELYVDADPSIWNRDPAAVTPTKPLRL